MDRSIYKALPIWLSFGDSVLDSAVVLRDSLWICDFAAVIPVLLIEFCVVWFCFVSVLFVYVFDFVMFLKWFCVFVIFFQKALAGGLE